jgi:hypothetical protein
VRHTPRGVHGRAPTGKRAGFQGQAIFHISEGKVLERRGMPDMLGLMQQIGAVPAPGQSEKASPNKRLCKTTPLLALGESLLGKGVGTADATGKAIG